MMPLITSIPNNILSTIIEAITNEYRNLSTRESNNKIKTCCNYELDLCIGDSYDFLGSSEKDNIVNCTRTNAHHTKESKIL